MDLKKQIALLPRAPGVYQFLDAKGGILYIGKAKDMRKRVIQHFQKSKNAPLKNVKMLTLVNIINKIQTDTELEALILESTLIKEHHPKYNILLRDDKNFLYIKISGEPFPQISMVRRITDRKSTYFGPYINAGAIRSSLTFAGKIFPYECLTFFQKGQTNVPCFNHHIQRCPGLCIGAVSVEEYSQIMTRIKDFLKGDIQEIIVALEQKMKQESVARKFEQAAKTRDQIASLKNITEKQKVVDPNLTTSQDIIGHVLEGRSLYVNVMKVRAGKLLGQSQFEFSLPPSVELDPHEYLPYVVQEYYQVTTDFPKTVIISDLGDTLEVIKKWLTLTKGSPVDILIPQKGKKHVLLELSIKNAQNYADQRGVHAVAEVGIKPEVGVKELQKALNINHKLKRLECYDISHLAGKFTVGSMVVFEDGKPLKADYRQFHISTIGDKIDDFQSIRETLERRLKYLTNPVLQKMVKDKKESFLKTPDLIIIDGGKGQLSIGVQVLSRLGLYKKIPIVSLAKEQEDIFIPEVQQPVTIPKDSQAQYLIERIRDEAHRFAISKNRNLRLKDQTKSKLDEIDGVGKILKKKLLVKFGSVAGIRKASEAELSKLVGPAVAKKIKENV